MHQSERNRGHRFDDRKENLVNRTIKVSYSTKDTIGEMGIGIGKLKR